MLTAESNVDHQDEDGQTPLHIAAYWGRTEIVERLIHANCNVELRDKKGQTALEIAASWHRYFIVKQLLLAGASFKGLLDSSLLHLASKRGDLGILKSLILAGANLETKLNGKTALHVACKTNNT